MKFKNISLKTLLIFLFIYLLYPVVKAVVSDDHLLVFSDSCLIIGLVSIFFGVFNSFVLHGDYDIASYILNKKRLKNEGIDYKEYLKQRKEKRKDSFNYPLFIGILMILFSLISALIV